MQTYTDEHIEQWGEVYVRECVAVYGISFEQFLYWPEAWMAAVENDRYAPLLAAQRSVRDRLIELEADVDHFEAAMESGLRSLPGLRVRDGFAVEPLHHSRYDRNGRRARIGRVMS